MCQSAKEDDAKRLEAGRAKGIEVRLLDRTEEDEEIAAQQDFGLPRVTAHLNSGSLCFCCRIVLLLL